MWNVELVAQKGNYELFNFELFNFRKLRLLAKIKEDRSQMFCGIVLYLHR